MDKDYMPTGRVIGAVHDNGEIRAFIIQVENRMNTRILIAKDDYDMYMISRTCRISNLKYNEAKHTFKLSRDTLQKAEAVVEASQLEKWLHREDLIVYRSYNKLKQLHQNYEINKPTNIEIAVKMQIDYDSIKFIYQPFVSSVFVIQLLDRYGSEDGVMLASYREIKYFGESEIEKYDLRRYHDIRQIEAAFHKMIKSFGLRT